MIIELLGLPGSGKTSIALQIEEQYPNMVFCIKGKPCTDSMQKCFTLKEYRDWLKWRTTIVLSFFLSPITIILFFKFLIKLASISLEKKISTTSNLKFFVYVFFLLNYQLARYLLAKAIAISTNKFVLIDEGLVYNSIRIRQFTDASSSRELSSLYVESVKIFGVVLVRLNMSYPKALARFKMREEDSPPSLFERWYINRSNVEWMDEYWQTLSIWIDELVIQLQPQILEVEDIDAVSISRKIVEFLHENR